jgi:hypothetical protein
MEGATSFEEASLKTLVVMHHGQRDYDASAAALHNTNFKGEYKS